jgi:hypothetical protein
MPSSLRALALPLAVLALYLGAEAAFRLRYFGLDALVRPWDYTAAHLVHGDLVMPDPDPAIAWRLRPGLATRHKGARFHTNRDGFRSPELARPAPPGSLRIAALGASIEMGAAVDDDATWPQQLERFLRGAGRSGAEVLNAGVGGYRAVQVVAAYERDVAPFAPDAVLLPCYADEFAVATPLRPRPLREERGSALDVRNALQRFFLYPALRDEMRAALRPWLALDWRERARPRRRERGLVDARAVLGSFVLAREAEGVRVFLVILPLLEPFDADAHDRFRREVERWSEPFANAPILDVAGLLGDRIGPGDRAYPGESHPGAAAQARIGRSVGELLLPLLPR